MGIIERPDPREHLDFLIRAHSEWGWAIFPLHKIKHNFDGSRVWCACHKGLTCESTGKHPLICWTVREQYPDADGIRSLFEQEHTGWGVHLGWSGLVVLDQDPRNGSWQTIGIWEGMGLEMPDTFRVTTGSDGGHVYFRAVGDIDPIKGCYDREERYSTNIPLGAGLEFLSGQHFVVLPFSPHRSGKYYRIGKDSPLADFVRS